MGAAAVLLVALVADDGTVLRSAADDAAPAQAMLYRGDWLEVRGDAPGFLKVWDHRRERPGYVRPTAVRLQRADETSADELRAVVRFVRDEAGMESLGVGYAALYLKVAPAARRQSPEWAEVLGALGTMAERLARRATAPAAVKRAGADATLAGQLSVVESYGVRFLRFERGQRTVVCYDGDAFARLLALPAAPAEERGRAALALTNRACLDPAASPTQRRAWNQARLDLLTGLDGLEAAKNGLGRLSAHRLRLRAVDAFAERAHDQAVLGQGEAAARAAGEAMRRLALVDPGELAPEDRVTYSEAALRASAVRWLAEPPAPPVRRTAARLEIAPGRAGETCVRLRAGGPPAAKIPAAPPIERCTFGVVFPSSLRWAPSGRIATLAVAPVAGWTELWIVRAGDDGRIDVLPPALGTPGEDLGNNELAGFSPDGRRLLVARVFRVAGKLGRRFEVLAPDALTVERWAATPERLTAFQRWSSPGWRKTTLASR
jgi:hypothetical protein